jgi:light-regulated signal transduction histidine kinase (bacteriophytochrome)
MAEPPISAGSDKEVLMKLSHDLQGSIRKINQFADWLNQSTEKKLSSEEQTYVNGIQRSAQQMQNVLAKALTQLSNPKP